MAAIIQPTSHIFIYKKYATLPVPAFFTLEEDSTWDVSVYTNVYANNLPPWLEIFNVFYNNVTLKYEFSIRVKNSYALSMTAGFYSVQLAMWISRPFLFGTGDFSLDVTIPITLEVKDTTFLSISPTTKLFNYIIGDAFPQNETLQVSSESNWSVAASQSWVTLTQSSGSGVGQLYFGVDPTGLAVGQYEAIITVQDNLFTKTVVVVLVVSEGDTLTSYLNLEPRNLQYVSEFGLANTTVKTLNLENSHAWVAVASQTWIVLSASSGAAGNSAVTVTVNSEALAVNNYTGEIVFTSNGIIKKVFVVLSVVEFLASGIESEGLYFCDDRNKLNVTNIENNTYLTLDADASFASGNLPYSFEAPYFKGLASIVIGTETNNLLKSVIPTNNFTSRVKNNIVPININLTAFNKNKITETTAQIAQYANLKFLTGKTPVIPNKLCYVPQTIYVTKNAVLSLSLLANTSPSQIVITGAVAATIGVSAANNLYVYNALINLSEFALTTGNAITITYGSLAVNVVIKKNEPEVNILAFENEWREYEFFETTGFLTTTKNAEKTDTEIQIEGEIHTKTVSIKIGKDYVINTGYILTQEEVDWLSELLNAKRVFLYEGTNPVEISMETKSLQVYKTREYGRSYLLKFKKAIV